MLRGRASSATDASFVIGRVEIKARRFAGGPTGPLLPPGVVKVVLTPQGREFEVERAKRVADLLQQLDITPGTVLVIRGDQLLTEDARLSTSDEIELRSVVSGG